jgi:arsenate reductase-like glutaredoxin family protein
VRRDYFKERFTREELADVLRRAGLTPREALSKRSRAYRELGLAEREVSDDELLDLMVAEPTLLRRPLLLTPEGSALGFDRKRMDALFGAGETG